MPFSAFMSSGPLPIAAVALLYLTGSSALAQLRPGTAPTSQEHETALALSACPPAIAPRAGVYVLHTTGYVKVRESTNGFNALVQHSTPGAQEPQCMDAEASRTVMVRYMKYAEWRVEGKSAAEIKNLNAEAFANGTFPAVTRVAVDYMLSPHNEVTNFLGKVTHFPPHVMFIGTRMTNAELGVAEQLGPDGNPIGPAFVAAEGTPYAMVIVPAATGAHDHPQY